MATPRTPAPKQVDPAHDRDKAISLAHARRIKKVLDAFVIAGSEFKAAAPGTIGHRQALVRAKACRAAVNGVIAEFAKRQHLDGAARACAQMEQYTESLERHEQLSPEDARAFQRGLRKVADIARQKRESCETQRNAIDERATTS